MLPIISSVNWVDGASVTSSSEAPSLSAAALMTTDPSDVWRSLSGETEVAVDFGVARDVAVVAFAQWMGLRLLGVGDRVRLRLEGGDGAVIYDTGLSDPGIDPRYGYWVCTLPTPMMARRMVVSFLGGAPYVQVGRLWAGPALSLEEPWCFGWEMTPVITAPAPQRLPSGIEVARRGRVVREMTLPFQGASDADQDVLEGLDALAVTAGQIFVCADPTRWAARTLIGRVTPAPSRNVVPGLWDKTLIIREA